MIRRGVQVILPRLFPKMLNVVCVCGLRSGLIMKEPWELLKSCSDVKLGAEKMLMMNENLF
jgi:hypothetical protein